MKRNKKEELLQLLTPEGERLMQTPDVTPWEIYPRPTMRRSHFLCLNGIWDFGTVRRGDAPAYGEQIRVPFVPESILSGVGRQTEADDLLCYRRAFTLPNGFENGRILLHVDAADQIAEVFVNGKKLGEHRGGYERFTLDVTESVDRLAQNTLEILVWDELDRKVLPYGKQCRARGGMWYTPISGIWQSVWMECVPFEYIRSIDVQATESSAEITVKTNVKAPAEGRAVLHLPEGDRVFAIAEGRALVEVEEPILWSPECPHLYEITVEVGEDRVESYFALRTLEIKEYQGTPRLCLNGKPYFFHGLLDQGYFSDGIFLPAEPNGYARDILAAKELGFNMLRKHIKLEPEIFYYECDRLGMVVFQDMVNNGDYSFFRDTVLPTVGIKRRNDRRMHRDPETRAAFLDGMKKTVERLRFHPSVCYWTIFNEGWGQFDHAAAYKALRELDSTRFVDSVSGWFMPPRGEELASDVESIHVYFKPVRAKSWKKPLVLSEFGGYSTRIEGHCFNPNHSYGYRTMESCEALGAALERLYLEEILPLVKRGLCADVYTQLTDVEDEINGLLTYDRRITKVDAERMRRIADALRAASKEQSGEC